MNDGEPTDQLNYGNYRTKFAAEPVKCQCDNKQKIEFNSRLKSLAKFDGHFCNKKFCCVDETNGRRAKENGEQFADDGHRPASNRQRSVDGIRQRTAQRSKQTNQLDVIRRTSQLKDQSNQQTRPSFQSETFRSEPSRSKPFQSETFRSEPFQSEPYQSGFLDQSDCGCCCCPSRCLARSLRLRREASKRQLETEFCDCEFCTNRESENQKLKNRNQPAEDTSTSSFGSCESKKKCQIVNLIRESVSSRGNSLKSSNDQINRQLFDGEYRRLVRKNRETNKEKRISRPNEGRVDQREVDNAIQQKYDSWSSHLHISTSPRLVDSQWMIKEMI